MTRSTALCLLFTLSLAFGCNDGRTGEGRFAGECADGADNDGNGMFDCADPGCFGAPDCEGAVPAMGADGGTLDAGPSPMADASTSPGSFTCCINSTGYRCPDMESLNRCGGGVPEDPSACFERCAFDDIPCMIACEEMLMPDMPDPSGCTADSTVECSCRGTGSCITSRDCSSSDHCIEGLCYSGFAGCRCLPSRGSDHCNSGSCSFDGECE